MPSRIGRDFQPSTIETIDEAMFKYVQNLNLHARTDKGYIPVPIIWVGAERTYQIKHDLTLRDKEGLLKLPIITIERKEITKDITKSPIPANIPDYGNGGYIPVRQRINQERTVAFKAAQNVKKSGADDDVGFTEDEYPESRKFPQKIAPMFDVRPSGMTGKVVLETTYIPIPVYVTVKYEIHIRTEYQSQMNTLITPFIAAHSGVGRNHRYFVVNHDNHRFEAFIDGTFSNDNNAASLGEEERMFNTTVNIEVLGYLISGGSNENKNPAITYENMVEVKVSRERVLLGDDIERDNLSGSDPFYKE